MQNNAGQCRKKIKKYINMKVYSCNGEDFYSLKAVKEEMRKTGKAGYIFSIRSNGDVIEHGEVKIKGSNKTFTSNTKQVKANY
jgi:hypothetical protein